MREREAVKVSFRVGKSGSHKGEVTAVFSGDDQGRGLIGCYAHMGQHGTCSSGWVHERTRPATPDEYADLLKELDAIGYDVTVVRRIVWP